MIRRLLLVMLLAVPLHAQEKPKLEVPRFSRKVFMACASRLAASKTADAIATRQLLDRGGVELNPVFGRHPSPAKHVGNQCGNLRRAILRVLSDRAQQARMD